jgi:membrane fusion protein (multidrug efflux system)
VNVRVPFAVPLLVALATAGCGDAGAEHSATAGGDVASVPAASGTRVEAATMAPSGASLQLRLPGEVAGSRDALLATASGGYVESVRVERGAFVKKGQTIATVNTSVYAAQRDQAGAAYELAKNDLGRVEAMGDLASESQRDGARTQVATTKANLRLAQLNVARSVVSAPFAGTVTHIDLEVGEVVGPAAPVARLVRLDPAFVTVAVADRDISVLREGMEVSVSVDAVPGVITGNIRSIDKAADTQTRAFRVEVELPNPDHRLLPGMIASVSLSAEVEEGAVILPQDWLVTTMDGIGVFVVEEGVARWRPVEAGTLVHDQIVIRSGLENGETVVINGHRSLADGDSLIISRQGTCCTNGRATY